MKKLILNSTLGILVTLTCSSQAVATTLPPPLCQSFSGNLLLKPDLTNGQPACRILERSDTRVYFSDLLSGNLSRFIAATNPSSTPPAGSWCFTGTINNGILGGQSVWGESYSGQTTNNFPDTFSMANSAATTVVLYTKPPAEGGYPLGNIYFRDTFFITDSYGSAKEQLVVIGASGLFWGIKGTLQIEGNEFFNPFSPNDLNYPGAPFVAQFCR